MWCILRIDFNRLHVSVYISRYYWENHLENHGILPQFHWEKWLHLGSFVCPRSAILLQCDKFTSILIAGKSSKERLLRGDLKVLLQWENESCQSSCKHCFYSYVPWDSSVTHPFHSFHSLIQLFSDCHEEPLVVQRRDSTYRLQRLFGRNLDEMCQWWQIPIIKHNVFTWNRGIRLIEMQPWDNDGKQAAGNGEWESQIMNVTWVGGEKKFVAKVLDLYPSKGNKRLQITHANCVTLHRPNGWRSPSRREEYKIQINLKVSGAILSQKPIQANHNDGGCRISCAKTLNNFQLNSTPSIERGK